MRSRRRAAIPPAAAADRPALLERAQRPDPPGRSAERPVAEIPDLLFSETPEYPRDERRRELLSRERRRELLQGVASSAGSSPIVSTRARPPGARCRTLSRGRAGSATARGPCAPASARGSRPPASPPSRARPEVCRLGRPAADHERRVRIRRGEVGNELAHRVLGERSSSVISNARRSPKSEGVARSCSSPPRHSAASTSTGFVPSRRKASSGRRKSSSPHRSITGAPAFAGLTGPMLHSVRKRRLGGTGKSR